MVSKTLILFTAFATVQAAVVPSSSPPLRDTPCGPNGQKYCGDGKCYDLLNDDLNCGECVHVCLRGQACENGECIKKQCQPGWEHCLYEVDCVGLSSNTDNCGHCNLKCLEGMICTGGGCDWPPGHNSTSVVPEPTFTLVPEPSFSYTKSPAPPVYPSSNPEEPSVSAGHACNSGAPGFLYCGATHGPGFECFNTLNDNRHCGSCENWCRVGENCVNGVCNNIGGCGAQTYCPGGHTGECVNLDNDNNNCGGCNNHCKVGQNCAGGRCR
ncbi:hypothetical protein CspHIS471_0310760 [Cutaneotrichosporon sp. HIS471]|nr:hypothetical protein CspHIS471_0310760 [Cutaneotrichosporon sp. HIS471]